MVLGFLLGILFFLSVRSRTRHARAWQRVFSLQCVFLIRYAADLCRGSFIEQWLSAVAHRVNGTLDCRKISRAVHVKAGIAARV